MPTDPVHRTPAPVPPPSEHQLALMTWLAVLPTLDLALSGLLTGTPTAQPSGSPEPSAATPVAAVQPARGRAGAVSRVAG